MIQIVLLILKIIGIAILSVLGLLLLLLLLVLFVPVFYRVRIVHNPEETKVKAEAVFLPPALVATFRYLKKVTYKVRIFGFALVDSERPKKEKKQKKKPSKKKTTAKAKEKKEEKVSSASSAGLQEDTVTLEPVVPVQEEQEQKQQEANRKKEGFLQKIRNVISNIRSKIKKIRETISNLIKKVKKLLRQKDEIKRILALPETKAALTFAWGKLKRLLKHILPRKMKGYLAYGADDPATTGQVLGVLSVLYARTGQLLTIQPNFTEKQLECDVVLKGRIQIFTLVVIAVKVFINQDFRQLMDNIKGLREIE